MNWIFNYLHFWINSVVLWQRFFHEPPENSADIVVLFDPNQVWMQGSADFGQNGPMAHGSISHTLQTLTFSGYAFDWMTLDDYLEEPDRYRAVVFLNQFSISKEQQKRLLEKLRRPDVTAIWNIAPGIASEDGFSDAAMQELTGLTLKHSTEKRHFIARQTNGRPLKLLLNIYIPKKIMI